MNILERLNEAKKHPLARSSYLTALDMVDPVIGPAVEKTYGIIRDRKKLREVMRRQSDDQFRNLPADEQERRLREDYRALSDAEIFDEFFVEEDETPAAGGRTTVKYWLLDEAGARVLTLTEIQLGL